MSDQNEVTSPQELIGRIESEAENEAQKIRMDAEHSISEKRTALEKRVEKIGKETDARIEQERERLRSHADAQIALFEEQAALRRENRIYRTAIDRTRDAIQELRESEDYTSILADWIAEAALGLDTTEAVVSAPEADQPFLEEAVEAARRKLNERDAGVSLRIGDAVTVGGQGVVLRDSAGRRSFSNLVSDRLRRSDSRLRRIVFHEVIEDQS